MNFFKKQSDKRDTNFENFPPIGGVMASKMIVDQNIKPRFIYREKRTRPEDSGWRIFTGLESDDYANNPDNIGIYNPSTILKIDPSITQILLKGIGSVYEKTEDSKEWHKVTDFELEDDYLITDHLTDEWTIEINNLFEKKPEQGGSLLYTTGDKSLRIAIWNEEGKSRQDLYIEYLKIIEDRDQTFTKTLKAFDFSDSEIKRIGYLIREDDGNKNYAVVYGFSIIENQIIQLAFYVDDDEDLTWAIETWNSIRLEKK